MSYNILLTEEAQEYLEALDKKSRRIVKENLEKLSDDPYPRPGSGRGDIKKETVDGEEVFRLHIGRTHTAFFVIVEAENEVRVIDIMPIDEAHKRYGFE